MRKKLLDAYEALVLDRPALTLVLVAVLTLLLTAFIPRFQLDVSADSLILENDADLDYYRGMRARYGSDEFLIVAVTPDDDLFGNDALAALEGMTLELGELERIASVISILNVPLLMSPMLTADQLQDEPHTLRHPDTDLALARRELVDSPLYSNRLMSSDGKTTAIRIGFRIDEQHERLLWQRDDLRKRGMVGPLSDTEQAELDRVTVEYKAYRDQQTALREQDIARIRAILDPYREHARIFLGGGPMIIVDIMGFIRHDLVVFGVSVLAMLGLFLWLVFRRPRWVLLPLATGITAGLMTTGFLGWLQWPVTVVSANFLALVLIFSLSLVIHLIVRYRELHRLRPDASQRQLVSSTLRSKAAPSLFTVLTTMVAFLSLVVSDIRPVIDFGWIMVVALAIVLVLAFTLFPAALMLLQPGKSHLEQDLTSRVTTWFARLVEHHGPAVLTTALVLFALSVWGVTRLSVENRFIDYFHDSTEIRQGMVLMDRELGGTTPLDIIIDAPEPEPEPVTVIEPDAGYDDPIEEDFVFDEEEGGITADSYWFNMYMLEKVAAIHSYLDQLPDTGKVMSLDTGMKVLKALDTGGEIDDFFLAILYKRLPPDAKAQLIDPYLSADGNQIRLSLRVHDSNPELQRDALLAQIREHLTGPLGLQPEQVHLSGMMVLYNNLLQSLFRSQVMTLGAVFAVILLTFVIIFRSVRVALVAIIPNLLAATMVLGLMGALGVPLDIMTITIAAITVGIAVDNTIHYIYRHRGEWQMDANYSAANRRTHASIGRAMYYTTLAVTVGFGVMALSDFVPTVYFGVFTAFAMISALIANLTVLPALLKAFRPYN